MALATYRCEVDQWTPLRADLTPIPFTPPVIDPDPEPDPNPGDLGTPGNRPALTSPPDATSTGPREATTQTMTGPEALTAIMAAPVEADGFRYLRRTNITGGITLDSNDHTNLRFEDCTITGGTYTTRTFYLAGTAQPSANWPEFRFCEIDGDGANSATIGGWARYLRCNIHRGIDLAKPMMSGGEYYGCYMHDTWHAIDAHCDVFQIRSRADGLLIHWNNLQGFNATDSPSAGGDTSNGVLQTGTMSGDIGPVQWLDNWCNGGHFTFRTGVAEMRLTHSLSYEYRRNKFGRGSRWGVQYGLLDGVIWDDTNVWQDTGLPAL